MLGNGVGDRVQATGVYAVIHHSHRGGHQVTLNEGERFPACHVCKDKVIFEFIPQVSDPQPVHIGCDRDFSKPT
jgi:hypothetical protein